MPPNRICLGLTATRSNWNHKSCPERLKKIFIDLKPLRTSQGLHLPCSKKTLPIPCCGLKKVVSVLFKLPR